MTTHKSKCLGIHALVAVLALSLVNTACMNESAGYSKQDLHRAQMSLRGVLGDLLSYSETDSKNGRVVVGVRNESDIPVARAKIAMAFEEGRINLPLSAFEFEVGTIMTSADDT